MVEAHFECPGGDTNLRKCHWVSIRGSVRDVPEVGVRQCDNCGLVTHNKDLREFVNYADGTMHTWTSGYGELPTNPVQDVDRRINSLIKLDEIKNAKLLLDFGSGDGTMLKSLSSHFSVSGLEPEISARENSEKEGFSVYDSIEELVNKKLKFDVITMFHVIEHVYNPGTVLVELRDILADDGVIVLETPNANDALLRLYANKGFENWTYWSHHPMVYSHQALKELVTRSGYKLVENLGVQRYSIANHLFWLSQNKPGGHETWKDLFSAETSESYNNDLISRGENDTLWLVAKK